MMYGSWDIKGKGQSFLSSWAICCPLPLVTIQKTKISKKKKLKIISFYTCIPQMTIIWRMVPELSSATEFFVILGYFLPFTPPPPPHKCRKSKFWKHEKHSWRYHFTHAYQKSKSYDVWFLRYGARETEFFLILDHFLPFHPPPL